MLPTLGVVGAVGVQTTLTGGTEDTLYEISYTALSAVAVGFGDVDGTTPQFRITGVATVDDHEDRDASRERDREADLASPVGGRARREARRREVLAVGRDVEQ